LNALQRPRRETVRFSPLAVSYVSTSCHRGRALPALPDFFSAKMLASATPAASSAGQLDF
jgi:hypothetical protein